jgi:hypothetical protein
VTLLPGGYHGEGETFKKNLCRRANHRGAFVQALA